MLGAAENVQFYHSVIFQVFKRFEHIMYIKRSGLFFTMDLQPSRCKLHKLWIKVRQDRVS